MGVNSKPSTLWYFAYGSNMSKAKFTGSRGIAPIATTRVRLPHWRLIMEIPGLPYSEPAFGSITPRTALDLDVIGVAYLITAEQYRRVVASEGGGTAYADVAVVGVGLSAEDQLKLGNGQEIRTLASSGMTRSPTPKPSLRYMSLLLDGASEAQLPSEYCAYLERISTYRPPSSWWRKSGAWIFLGLWGPVIGALEKITNDSIGEDGNAPGIVVWLVRFTMWVIWLVHDWIFAPVFGRGDGQEQESY